MSSSLGLLAEDIQISFCHSLTGTAEPPPLASVELTAELQQSFSLLGKSHPPPTSFFCYSEYFFFSMVRLLFPMKIPLSLLFSWIPHQNP
jgi:hypothetical protein